MGGVDLTGIYMHWAFKVFYLAERIVIQIGLGLLFSGIQKNHTCIEKKTTV